MKTLSWSAGIALLTIAVWAPSAGAETTKCQRTIAKASSQFVQAKIKTLSKCEGGVVKGKIPGPCPDDKTTASIDKASAKMAAAIGKSCGGADQVCGHDLTGEDTPVALGWPATCPTFEHLSCFEGKPIHDCGDITTCLTCIDETAVDQAIKLYYDNLVLPSTGDLNKCQISIGKAASAFLVTKTKALQKCWDAKMTGKLQPAANCVDPNPGDGKYLAAIAKAEAKKAATICKACGGTDGACGGAADLTPAQIGFGATCPAVTVPGGDPCGGAITDLLSIIKCVDCVTEFTADGSDRLQVPQYTPYPPEFSVCTAPTPSGPCPTSLEFTADGPSVDLDAGWTGLGHNSAIPTNGRLTLAVSGCAGGSQPTCGQCNVSGPLANAGGITFNNQRCSLAPWVQCSTDPDCTGLGTCVFFFGAPLPGVAGGVTTCVLNQVSGPVTGTINIDDGTSTTNVPLASKVHTGTTTPCPNCVAGKCTDGPRVGQACAVNGTGLHGDVSLDCPPNPGSLAGTLVINLNASTGTQVKTVTVLNPTCHQTGYTDLKCLCDTCNNGNRDACSTNAECPDNPPGTPGICGGKRCLGGTNAGVPCANKTTCADICVGGTSPGAVCNSDGECTGGGTCPGGGQCDRAGEPTQPNPCIDDSATPEDEGHCVDVGNNEGVCPYLPVEKVCSLQTFQSCVKAADCDPSPTFINGLAGQSCIGRNRSCFVDNGVIGQFDTVSGTADAPCGGTAHPTVGTFFCIAPVSATSVNAAAGLPGLGRARIPSTQVIIGP